MDQQGHVSAFAPSFQTSRPNDPHAFSKGQLTIRKAVIMTAVLAGFGELVVVARASQDSSPEKNDSQVTIRAEGFHKDPNHMGAPRDEHSSEAREQHREEGREAHENEEDEDRD